MTRISAAQRHVMQRMNEGWELGASSYADQRIWLQQGGIGCGGAVENVSRATFRALWMRNLIAHKSGESPYASPRRYVLTGAGIAALAGEGKA